MRKFFDVRGARDAGFAMVTVVIALVMLMLVSTLVLTTVLRSQSFQRNQQDYDAALQAAQAGVDDYVQRLNASGGTYYQYDGVTTFPTPANPAMGFDVQGKPNWAGVQTGGKIRGYFHYSVDTSTYTGREASGSLPAVTANGTLSVTSTGKVGGETRTVVSTVRRNGFLDNLYYTVYETKDPFQYPSSGYYNKTWAANNCADFYGDRSTSCGDIQFGNDTLSGPVYSQDIMMICNDVTFKSKVMTSHAAMSGGKFYRTNNCGSTNNQKFESGLPYQAATLDMPSTNGGLKAQTASTAVPRGCLYVGPTKITIKGSKIYVDSPWTKSVRSECALKTWINIPTNGVIYVDNVPSTTTDENYWKATDANRPTCPSVGNNLGYPISGETNYSDLDLYGCKVGDVFIQEEGGLKANALDGRLTIAAKNDLIITDNIDYKNGTSGKSMLGLIAERNLWYWHPTNSSGNYGQSLWYVGKNSEDGQARVSAALLSVQHSIGLMNPARGNFSGVKLSITGNLTQKFRGIVRNVSGYDKNYIYDPRLQYDAPPHFLEPTTSSFVVKETAELSPLYQAK